MVPKLKALGKPVGQALGHSPGDPPFVPYPLMWSYGGKEPNQDGKTVVFNSKETTDAVSRFAQEWKNGFDETGLSWDDSSNNRAFLADQISVTNNGLSIYLTALKSNPDIAKDMDHALNPQGPGGRFHAGGVNGLSIMSYSKNQAAAKEFLKWWLPDEQHGAWFRTQNGYFVAGVKKRESVPLWPTDPKIGIAKKVSQYYRFPGYQAPSGVGPTESVSKYIVVDVCAQAVSTGNAKGAVQNARSQLKQIFTS